MSLLRAFHGDPRIKDNHLTQLRAYVSANQVVEGVCEDRPDIWANVKDCIINHADYETHLGIPIQLAYLKDRIYAGLSASLAQFWPVRFIDTIQVSAELSDIPRQFAFEILADPDHGCLRLTKPGSSQYTTIANVIEFLKFNPMARAMVADAWLADAALWATWANARAAELFAWSEQGAEQIVDLAKQESMWAAQAAAQVAVANAKAITAARRAEPVSDAVAKQAVMAEQAIIASANEAQDAALAAVDHGLLVPVSAAPFITGARTHHSWMADTLIELLKQAPILTAETKKEVSACKKCGELMITLFDKSSGLPCMSVINCRCGVIPRKDVLTELDKVLIKEQLVVLQNGRE